MIHISPKDLVDVVPQSTIVEEVFNDRPCLVIRNPVYCRVFWMRLWATRLINSLKVNRYYKRIKNVDLDRIVIIDLLTESLVSAPEAINVLDFQEKLVTKDDYFYENVLLPQSVYAQSEFIASLYAIVLITLTLIGLLVHYKQSWYTSFLGRILLSL